MEGNKGIEFSMIVIFIVSIIILILLMLYAGKLAEIFKSTIEQNKCKTSVYTFSKLYASSKVLQQYTLSCPVSKLTVNQEEEVFSTVAKEMATLWDNFGEGKLELFAPEDEVFCVLGSHITFDMKKEMRGFLPYIAEHAYKKTSYLEYLTGIPPSAAQKTSLQASYLQQIDKIDTSKPLGIIFIYSKDAMMTKQEGTIYGMGIGSVVGIVAGVATLFYFPPAGISVIGITIISPLITGAAQMAGVTAVSALFGTATGYLFGYDKSAEWDARILAVPFTPEEIGRLPCTYWPVPVV